MAPLIGITAGFGGLLGPDLLAQIKDHGITYIRQGDQRADASRLHELTAEIVTAGLKPILLCTAAQVESVPDGIDVEIRTSIDKIPTGLEPAFTDPAPEYAAAMNAVAPIVRAKHLRAWVGMTGTNPKSKHDLPYLATFLETLDPIYGISVHRYPPSGAERWTDSPIGSRYKELELFKKTIGARPFMVGECGWDQAPYRKWYDHLTGRHRHIGDLEQASLLAAEIRYWQYAGAAFTCIYQLHDGPERCPVHPWMPAGGGFGIRRADGTWKPSSRVAL